MDKIKFIASRFNAETSWQLNDGRIFDITGMVADRPFNLETGEISETICDPKRSMANGLPDDAPDGFTTLNNLYAQGNGHKLYCYDEYNINLGEHPNMGDKDIDAVIAEFEDAGYKVTKAAILHNYYAWSADQKSGYRDKANGYHLFSPCGCNPFILRATTLHPLCEDWQTTYEA